MIFIKWGIISQQYISSEILHTTSILHSHYLLQHTFSSIEQCILFIYTMIGLCILFAETISDPSSIIRKVHWNFTWLYMILSEWQSAKKHIFSNWFVSTWRNLWYADNKNKYVIHGNKLETYVQFFVRFCF